MTSADRYTASLRYNSPNNYWVEVKFRFGRELDRAVEMEPCVDYSALLTSLIRGSAASIRLR
jgi:hypothetical protein